jgi:hypothetical protein
VLKIIGREFLTNGQLFVIFESLIADYPDRSPKTDTDGTDIK